MVGLGDPEGVFQPRWFYDSVSSFLAVALNSLLKSTLFK